MNPRPTPLARFRAWEVSTYNDLGLPDDTWIRVRVDDALVEEQQATVDFDELGRFTRYANTTTSYGRGGSSTDTTRVETFTYDCP